MWLLPSLKNIRVIQKRAGWDRSQVLAYQEQQFRDLLRYVWNESPFYHGFYSDHGIREQDLADLTHQDLPILSKEILMESFDRISKNPVLRREPIEAWIHASTDSPIYEKQFLILHTSGTSGTMGIFAYDKHAWSRMRGVTTRAGSVRINPFNRVRLAYYGATHGRFAGVSSCSTLPRGLCNFRLCSILDPMSKTVKILNDLQPEHLFGYANGIQELAVAAIDGQLRIRPSHVTTSGEPLTDQALAAIKEAWGLEPTNAYGTTESLCLGIQTPGQENITLMEDETIIEILDTDDRQAEPGESGRMVITSLYNRAIPVIRYDLRDLVTRGHRKADECFDNILRVEGRANDALPVKLEDGSMDKIHPVVLSEFFVPGVRKFQFIAESDSEVRIKYIAGGDLDSEIRDEFVRILTLKGAEGATSVTAERVDELPADQATGKHRLVLLQAAKS